MEVKFLLGLIFLSVAKANEVFLVYYPGGTQDNAVRYTIHNFGNIYDHPSFRRGDLHIFSYGNLQTLSHPFVQEVIVAHLRLKHWSTLSDFVAIDYSEPWILDGGVQRLGDQIGVALLNLFNRGHPASLINLIGFGTAAHIVSVASLNVFRNGHLIRRVTGLSPTAVANQINPNVAEMVDVIHTNTAVHGNLNSQGLETFYVNGGAQQPWCGNDHACSHDSAMRLWAESVDFFVHFPSLFCSSWENFCRGQCNDNLINHMGFWGHASTRGFFFLQTNNSPPFSRNDHLPSGC